MALAEQKRDDTMHQIVASKSKHVEIHRLSSTVHNVDAYTNNLVKFPGLEKTITIDEDETDIIVMVLGHAHAFDSTVSLAIMIDQNQLTMNYPHDINQCPGTGHTYVSNYHPIASIGGTTLKRGTYHVCVGVRNDKDNGKQVRCAGVGMIIQVFKPCVMKQWIDIDLDDENLFFNKDLEYQIEIRGKAFASALTVEKENLWFFYSDTKNTANNGIKNVNYKSKREFDTKCFVTKIQCKLRK
eukprot:10768_1